MRILPKLPAGPSIEPYLPFFMAREREIALELRPAGGTSGELTGLLRSKQLLHLVEGPQVLDSEMRMSLNFALLGISRNCSQHPARASHSFNLSDMCAKNATPSEVANDCSGGPAQFH
jgi:hypothetical protein